MCSESQSSHNQCTGSKTFKLICVLFYITLIIDSETNTVQMCPKMAAVDLNCLNLSI